MSAPVSPLLLEGKTAVVTGANRGIGKAIAETFIAHGAQVVACARTIDAAYRNWAETRTKIGPGRVSTVGLDLSDETLVTEAIKNIRSVSPVVDVLVNNAGVAVGGLFQMMSASELRTAFSINFFNQMVLTQGLVRLMARRKAGSIISMASTAALVPSPGTLAYGASKAAFARASQSMATELGALGIRVNVIAPGVTMTDMADQMDPKARDRLIASSALNRAADPQDIANAALFLASDLSSHITGQILRVDGGMV